MNAPWLRTMSASKIAAVVGLSPYDSRFSLWHRMAGNLGEEVPPAPELQRGHYLEPAILAWFRDQHPEWKITRAGVDGPQPHQWTTLPDGRAHPVWFHPDEPCFTASPDGHAVLPDGEVRTVEIKTAASDDEWGEAGTDEIPPGYAAQVQWQMYVCGTKRTHVAVLTSRLQFREYVVDADPEDHAFLATEARAFLDTLPGGPNEKQPDLDAHSATYEAVKRLHPEIEDRAVDIPQSLAKEFCEARAALDATKDRAQLATTQIAALLGTAQRGVFLGQTIARRQAKGEGAPFLVAGRSLPTFTDEAAA